MKQIIKPLLTTVLMFSVPVSYAQSYSDTQVKSAIKSMDENLDDKITFQEFFEQDVVENKDSLDVNHDGYITQGEIVLEIKEDLIQTIEEMRKQGVSEENINKTIAKELNTAEQQAAALIKKMDTDHDNLVEPLELKKFEHKTFDALDKNHDGVISQKDTQRAKGFPVRIRNR